MRLRVSTHDTTHFNTRDNTDMITGKNANTTARVRPFGAMRMSRASALRLLLVSLLAWAQAGCVGALRAPEPGGVPGKRVRSLQEMRDATVVRQRWDLSCGSAALSTLLTYDYGDRTSESLIITTILHRADPVRIKKRGGFSLLDLKRFVEGRGYTAAAYKGMTLPDLLDLPSPAIVRIRVKSYDHFVVFRGMRGDRVVLADPAFGIVTMRTDQFTATWGGGIGFVVHRPDAAGARARHDGRNHGALVLAPDPAAAARLIRHSGAVAPEMWRGR